MHNFAGKALQSLQAYHLVQSSLNLLCAMQIFFAGSPLWPKAWKKHGKLVLFLLPVLTRYCTCPSFLDLDLTCLIL